jgi:hypothetical protein
MQRGFSAIIVLVVFVVGLSLLGVVFHLGRTTAPKVTLQNNSSSPTPYPSISEQPTPTPSQKPTEVAEKDGWKTYSNTYYSLMYPSDWTLNTSDYMNLAELTNPNKTVSFKLTDGQYPYGYGGEVKFDTKDINLTVNGKEYTVEETTTNNTQVFVNFKLDIKNYHVLFGTGYPGGSDEKTSKEDYYSTKPTIMKILSSVKFTN